MATYRPEDTSLTSKTAWQSVGDHLAIAIAIAIAIGRAAIRAGRSVYFMTMADLITALARAEGDGSLRERIRFLVSVRPPARSTYLTFMVASKGRGRMVCSELGDGEGRLTDSATGRLGANGRRSLSLRSRLPSKQWQAAGQDVRFVRVQGNVAGASGRLRAERAAGFMRRA